MKRSWEKPKRSATLFLYWKTFETNRSGIQLDGQLQVSLFEVDQTWTSYTLKMIPGHPTNRLIVFRPHLSRDLLGCIRVYQAGTTAKLWDVYDSRDTFIGKVPKDCAFEAMVVDVKFIKQRESQS